MLHLVVDKLANWAKLCFHGMVDVFVVMGG